MSPKAPPIPSDIPPGALEVPEWDVSETLVAPLWNLISGTSNRSSVGSRTPPVQIASGPVEDTLGGLVGPRIVKYQLINTSGLIQALFLDVFQVIFS